MVTCGTKLKSIVSLTVLLSNMLLLGGYWQRMSVYVRRVSTGIKEGGSVLMIALRQDSRLWEKLILIVSVQKTIFGIANSFNANITAPLIQMPFPSKALHLVIVLISFYGMIHSLGASSTVLSSNILLSGLHLWMTACAKMLSTGTKGGGFAPMIVLR